MKKIWNRIKWWWDSNFGVFASASPVTDEIEDRIPCDERDPNVIHSPHFEFKPVKPLWDERGR